MSNIIDKIQLSGTNYDIQDSVLKGEIYISSTNRDSIQTVIKEGVYSLSTDDVYTITGSKAHSTDRVKGQIIVDNSTYNFTGSTSSDVEGVAALNGIVTFDLSSPFSITLVNRDVNKINELFIETFTNEGEESPMDTITITHNPSVGVNKIDYVSTLYTEFVHEKYALVSDLDNKQDTLVNQINIKSVNNQSLLGSGNITIQGGEGSPTVEVTQVQYDALVSAGTVSADTYYIITDATPIDLSSYWTSAQTQSAITSAVSTKQDFLVSGTNIKTINNESILGSGNIDIQGGGGGKAIEAGRGISITSGETADTVSFNLPISADTDGSVNKFLVGNNNTIGSDTNQNIIIGDSNTTYGQGSGRCYTGATIIGYNNNVGCIGMQSDNNDWSFVIGRRNKVNGGNTCILGVDNNFFDVYNNKKNYSYIVGRGNSANTSSDTVNLFAFGSYNKVTKSNEIALGFYNVSTNDGTSSGNTFLSIGNGTSENARHNAFEIRQNGDIYITLDGQDVKLQDNLGGGITSGEVQTMIDNSLSGYVFTADNGKQDIYGSKTFIGEKRISFTQGTSSDKLGFTIYDVRDSEGNASQLGAFELNPTAITESNTIFPLLSLGHYRSGNRRASVQSYIGFRQYDYDNSAAYHLLAPLPQNAKTPFSLTTSFKNFYMPLGIKVDNSTMVKADSGGVMDISSYIGGGSSYTAGNGIDITNDVISVTGMVATSAITTSVTSSSTDSQIPSAKAVNDKLGGLSIVKLTQSAYDALSPNYDSNTLYVIVN